MKGFQWQKPEALNKSILSAQPMTSYAGGAGWKYLGGLNQPPMGPPVTNIDPSRRVIGGERRDLRVRPPSCRILDKQSEVAVGRWTGREERRGPECRVDILSTVPSTPSQSSQLRSWRNLLKHLQHQNRDTHLDILPYPSRSQHASSRRAALVPRLPGGLVIEYRPACPRIGTGTDVGSHTNPVMD